MKLALSFFAAFLGMCSLSFGQINPLIVAPGIRLPKDSVFKIQLINSLNGFLSQKEGPNKDNTFVLKEDLLETSVLIDEIKEIEQNWERKDSNFYKGYLTNAVRLDSVNCLIQFSYIGQENVPVLRASFELLGKRKGDQFYFSSPLKFNTVSWKSKKFPACTFYYKNSFDDITATQFQKNIVAFDAKLKTQDWTSEFYYCDNYVDVLQMIGVLYKSDYNGRSLGALTAKENKHYLVVICGDKENLFDPHDLWHSRLRNAVSSATINRPVDEGCAYLYGGSWGITWPEILKIFQEKVCSDPKADWLSLYDSFNNFGDKKDKPLMAGYVINALLVRKIEKEKGFPAVMELLCCGTYEKGNEKYFKVLEKLTGINKTNFNEEIWKLVRNS